MKAPSFLAAEEEDTNGNTSALSRVSQAEKASGSKMFRFSSSEQVPAPTLTLTCTLTRFCSSTAKVNSE
jgi:hypothetical protein